MHTDNELKSIADFTDRKIEEILNSDEGTDHEYIKNLQTLIKLQDSANKALDRTARKRR